MERALNSISEEINKRKKMKGNFNSIINSTVPVLVDFHAEWCQPCKIQSPILQQIAAELKEKVKIIKIDVDKNQEIAMRFQVQGVPTLALFKNGNLLWKQAGVQTFQEIRNLVNAHQ